MPEKSSASGHWIAGYQPPENHPPYWTGNDCSSGLRCPEKRTVTRWWTVSERTYLTGGEPLFRAGYSYRKHGRAAARELYLCRTCGEKFAKRHGLELSVGSA
jgi:hypothetical protein